MLKLHDFCNRAPLANIRAQVELALRAESEEAMRAMLEKVDAASSRLVRLTGQLLTLSRIEAGTDGFASFTTFAIDRVVADAVAWSIPAALKKDIEIGFEAAEGALQFHGDQHAIEQLVANLVDNTVNHLPGPGNVLVIVRAMPDIIALIVQDNGPGLSEDDRVRVLNRFDRGTQPGGTGSGLGLSIAQEVVRLHNGSIWLRETMGGGLTVEVRLPIAL